MRFEIQSMLITTSHQILTQLHQLLAQLNAAAYAQPLAVFNGSSIGSHTRHIIEFYDCLLQGLHTKTVNYDTRQRDKLLETDRGYALRALERLMEVVQGIGSDEATPLTLICQLAANQEQTCSISSSFGREAIYLIEHNIHHFALIRIGIQQNFPEIEIPDEFGVAPSTIRYRNSARKILVS